MRTAQDSIAKQIPWDLAFVSGLPLILLVALLGGMFSLPAACLGFLIATASITAFLGGVIMTWAKIPLYRAGHFFRLGCSGVDRTRRRIYRIGLWVSIVSISVAAVLLGFLWLKA